MCLGLVELLFESTASYSCWWLRESQILVHPAHLLDRGRDLRSSSWCLQVGKWEESSRCTCWLPEADKHKNMLIAACINRYQSVSEGRELSLAKEGHCVLSIVKICLVITPISSTKCGADFSNLGGLKWRSGFVFPRPMLTSFIARIPDPSLFCFACWLCFSLF